jgi:Tol biopolymer transport system component
MHLFMSTASFDIAPAWSPDGRYIAFASDRDAPNLPGNTAIYVMKADGEELQRLTDPGQIDTMPMWSPDGKVLAFVSYRSGSSEIYTINSDGTHETRLTNDTADDYSPSWNPSIP